MCFVLYLLPSVFVYPGNMCRFSSKNLIKGSFINHVDRAGGGGVPKKPCLSTWGREGLEACPHCLWMTANKKVRCEA